eukprot:2693917-Rhodomonas_salina.2
MAAQGGEGRGQHEHQATHRADVSRVVRLGRKTRAASHRSGSEASLCLREWTLSAVTGWRCTGTGTRTSFWQRGRPGKRRLFAGLDTLELTATDRALDRAVSEGVDTECGDWMAMHRREHTDTGIKELHDKMCKLEKNIITPSPRLVDGSGSSCVCECQTLNAVGGAQGGQGSGRHERRATQPAAQGVKGRRRHEHQAVVRQDFRPGDTYVSAAAAMRMLCSESCLQHCAVSSRGRRLWIEL